MPYFTPDALGFLRDLAGHNDKAWFEANKDRYETAVREPALAFIEDVGAWFEAEGLPYRAEAKKAGGSLSRIHRDTRFSKDKTPYHTHMIIHFSHAEGSKTKPMPMFGIRFAADNLGLGGGIYGGDTPTLNKIRDRIVADPDGWAAAKRGQELWGDALKTAPKGDDKEHPLIEDIRRKAFMANAPLTEAQFTGDLVKPFQAGVKQLDPFMTFLADALR